VVKNIEKMELVVGASQVIVVKNIEKMELVVGASQVTSHHEVSPGKAGRPSRPGVHFDQSGSWRHPVHQR